ncbi:MAG: hypothetical protein NTX86_04875 [Candidatus Dependentiae bacterium]|nr:hypothetical protein [Candidatus Dependentiae bacterium]
MIDNQSIIKKFIMSAVFLTAVMSPMMYAQTQDVSEISVEVVTTALRIDIKKLVKNMLWTIGLVALTQVATDVNEIGQTLDESSQMFDADTVPVYERGFPDIGALLGSKKRQFIGKVARSLPRVLVVGTATALIQEAAEQKIAGVVGDSLVEPEYNETGSNKRYYAYWAIKWVLQSLIVPTLISEGLVGPMYNGMFGFSY